MATVEQRPNIDPAVIDRDLENRPSTSGIETRPKSIISAAIADSSTNVITEAQTTQGPGTTVTANNGQGQQISPSPPPTDDVAQQQQDSTVISPVQEAPKQSDFVQMETYLSAQLDKCEHYKKVFAKQDNVTLANKFETLFTLTTNDLEIVRTTWRECRQLPRFTFEKVQMTCVPTNVDVKEKELMITVKISGLTVAENAMIYAIVEFDYPLTGKEETVIESVRRWSHNAKIEPSKVFNCFTSKSEQRQLDMIYSTDIKPFYNPDSKQIHFDRAVKFFVDKGKSRTLKRKFKPVKFIFYEKTNMLTFDKKLGTVQIRIDAVNDLSTVLHRVPIILGRKQTDAWADIRVKVREPLVDKSLRNHEEKILVLT